MGRLLLFVAFAAVGWYLFRRIGQASAGAPGNPPPRGTGTAPAMLRCAECGVHAPEDTGVRYQGNFYCCPEHMNDHLRKLGQR